MAPTPPSESQILHSYLLHPSSLPTILPYKTFLSLLPKSSSVVQNSHPTELKCLYRDLQFQRDITIDDVRRRIESECLRSGALTARLKRQIAREEMSSKSRKRKFRGEEENDDGDGALSDGEIQNVEEELLFDTALHEGDPLSNITPHPTSRQNHNVASLLSALETAKHDLSSEIADLHSSIAMRAKECEDIVGGLSDLRYGRFAGTRVSGNTISGSGGGEGGGGLEEDVVGALEELRERLEEGREKA